jgi:ribosomal protein L11 methyltransferase
MLVRCEITVAGESGDVLSGMLAARVASGWEEQDIPGGGTRCVFYASEASFTEDLIAELRTLLPELEFAVSRVEEENWHEAWREYFTPVVCGDLFLALPPWREHDAPLEGRLPLIIEPRSAFGTGHHASTVLCLEALSELHQRGCIAAGMSFLDLGTGSGILGIACCRLGLSGIGLDTDPQAIENALENRERNGCLEFELAVGSLEVLAGRRFDVVLANILAGTLRELAPVIRQALKNPGRLVLSGILAGQADAVEASYRREGFGPARHRMSGEWTALVWDGETAVGGVFPCLTAK